MPSSLTMLPPSALGFSPCPPVSVSGTGARAAIAAFLGTCSVCFPTPFSVHFAALAFWGAVLPSPRLLRLCRSLHSRPTPPTYVPTVLDARSTGISTCRPSAAPLGLALGPDSPRADQLYPGNLGHPAGRIPTFLSLLIPAFSLRGAPPPLTVRLLCPPNAPLPAALLRPPGFGGAFQPRTFSAQGLSASELLRTLLLCGCF